MAFELELRDFKQTHLGTRELKQPSVSLFLFLFYFILLLFTRSVGTRRSSIVHSRLYCDLCYTVVLLLDLVPNELDLDKIRFYFYSYIYISLSLLCLHHLVHVYQTIFPFLPFPNIISSILLI